ncbi:hypothetical protein DBV15_00248 [Temnothorax longispinosus]|uniref:Uncharacterized protein n=1 Tax=Temnothorax longispinosus TaxID=300112 RepID=A0A4S2L0V9_9HYME|nr:hypothetical protein DBV15_00248 [Temnothorax longispinosus]
MISEPVVADITITLFNKFQTLMRINAILSYNCLPLLYSFLFITFSYSRYQYCLFSRFLSVPYCHFLSIARMYVLQAFRVILRYLLVYVSLLIYILFIFS